jgi:uncharacterized membrane protein YsdA (DUF1294 family)
MTLPIGLSVLAILLFNAVAFMAAGLDKRRAERGLRRIPERTLLLLSLPLAAPGLLLGMRAFRHKTGKFSFIARAIGVVFANLLLAAALGVLAMRGLLVLELRLY